MDEKFIARFWNKVDRRGPGECWKWTASVRGKGYGATKRPDRRGVIDAHRMSYWLQSGTEPIGSLVCHRCDNPPCVNPEHLFLGTYVDNNSDMRAKGRSRNPPRICGTSVNTAKLSERQVVEMRRRGRPGLYSALAREFGVTPGVARQICRREIWKHVP